jgi:antitoxin HicB
MQSWVYPARMEFHADNGAGASNWLVSFPDLPECITEGSDLKDAEQQAADALNTWIAYCLKHGRNFAPPRTAEAGEVAVGLDPALAARAALALMMTERGVSRSALAAKLGRDERAVGRMLRPGRRGLDAVLQALAALGAQPILSV